MRKACRILFESYDLDEPNARWCVSIIPNYPLPKPTWRLYFSLCHEVQIHLLQETLAKHLLEETALLTRSITQQPEKTGLII